MPAKVTKKASEDRTGIEAIFKKAMEPKAKAVANKAQPLLMPLYQRTLRYWGQSGENRFDIPSVIIETKIEYRRGRYIVTVTCKVISDLWGWLDQGTHDIIQNRTSPPIRERARLRTTPDQLDVNPFGGFTGKVFVIRAGRRRRGIPARRWSETIGRLFRQAVQTKPDVFEHFKVTKMIVNGKVT